ncbi:MAG: undecaprenyl-diphosphate phosphatase [Rubripirellula sp.]|nr:undecaprenyl-diphosphate phosphatase [Rubripirellula sp.]
MYKILILAVVQGIAEFLPISSSGHLIILGALLEELSSSVSELSESPTLEIILHAGTLGSILVVFWKRILNLLTSDRRVLPLLVVGTVPAAIVGLTIKSQFSTLLMNPTLAAAMLLVTGCMLVFLGRLSQRNGCYTELNWRAAVLIGCFQAFAILPGVSRSGSTILGGRLLGLKNEDSVTFSFLLAIPAILGASLLAVKDIWQQLSAGKTLEFSIPELALGASISFLVGLVALTWLIGWSRKDRLHWFAWWCFPAGGWALFHFNGYL